MQELIARIGTAQFIQVVIELWNSVFLLIMIFTMLDKEHLGNQKMTNFHDIPYTKEIAIFFSTVLMYNLFDVMVILPAGNTAAASYWLVRIFEFLYYTTGAFLTLFFLNMIKKYIAEKNNLRRLKLFTLIMQLLHIPLLILLAATPFTGALYSYDQNNIYSRGPFFRCWHGITFISFLFIMVAFIIARKQTDRFMRQLICTATIIPTIGFIMNTTKITGISYNNISASLTALIIYILYEKYRADVMIQRTREINMLQTQLAEKKLALEQSKNAMLVAQIQPHFINNSLMALRARCLDYPEIYESLTNFSKYLRSHFEAISDTKMITFEKEMENVEAYLDLERENYGDRLQVEYCIEYSNFLIPALTVQPLVENAVRHGIGMYEDGGTVFIKSFKADGAICIEIIDDGSGITGITEQQQKRRGIGIENVRARLQISDIGKLEIIRGEHGMTARITLSKAAGGAE